MANAEVRLRQRFVSDFNYPIQVLDDPYFERYLGLYEPYLGTRTKWLEICNLISTRFGDNIESFLQNYAARRDKIITHIEASNSYKLFISCNMGEYIIKNGTNETLQNAIVKEIFQNIPSTSVYIEPNDGKRFISLDMKQANFNALRYHDAEIVGNCQTYDDFIIYHLSSVNPMVKYFQDSKYTRQVIFGKLNMKRNITIQKYMMFLVWYNMPKIYNIYSSTNDELILEVDENDTIEQINEYVETLKSFFRDDDRVLPGISDCIRVELFTLKLHKFENSHGGNLSVYEKITDSNKLGTLKQCPATFYPQVYKLLTKQPIESADLVFGYEHQLAQFLSPLKKIKNEN
jgi:hypothetical protein